MFEPAIDPVHWTTKAIISLGDEVMGELAKRASATVNAHELLVGRCLLAIHRSRLYQRKGYSGATHYANIVLGLPPTKACELRRVARELEELPRLSKAAELGQVAWGKLRAIVSKATLETEEAWLRLAALRTCNEIEKLVASTERGKLPWETLEPPGKLTRFQFHLGAAAGELLERAIQAVSQENGRPMSTGEVIEHLAIERLAKRPLTPELIEATRKEARRGSGAANHRLSRLIEEARQLVQECGLSAEDRDDALAVALGAECLDAPELAEELSARDLSREAPLEILEVELDHGDNEEVEEEALSVEGKEPDAEAHDHGEEPSAETDSEDSEEPEVKANGDHGEGPRSETQNDNGEAEWEAHGQQDESADLTAPPEVWSSPECPGRDAHRESSAETNPGSTKSPQAPDEGTSQDAASSVLRVLISRALKEKKLFLELGEDDWRNNRLRFNPEARFLTPAQRKELLRRDGYCCSNPGCPNHLWLEFHHVVAVVRNGKTVRYNLVALCSRCHRNVHQGFLKITGDAELGLVFRDALGRDIRRVHAIRTADWLNFWAGWSPGRDDFHRPQLARAG